MSDKKLIPIELMELAYNLEGPIQEAVLTLQALAKQFPNANIDWDRRGYDDQYMLYLDDTRVETDQEFDKRVAEEAKNQVRVLERKKALLEQLKKELGDGTC